MLQRSNQIPKLPKDLVRPKIVAGINSLGRGQDAEALTRFIGTIAQTLGPEALHEICRPNRSYQTISSFTRY